MSKAKVASITSPPDVDAKASAVARLGQQALDLLSHKYRLLLDNKQQTVITEIAEPGVLQVVSKEVVLERDLIKRFGVYLTPSAVKRDLLPRWQAEMRARTATCLDFDAVKPFLFKSEGVEAGWAWQRLPFDPDEAAPMPQHFASMLARTSEDEARSVVLFIGSLFDYKFPRSQYLYLHGVGNDGKSTLMAAVMAMFAKQGVATMGADDLGDSHSTSGLEGVRLLVFPDLKKPALPSSGIFKQLTGDDVMSVNPKGLPRHNIRLHCRVIISSNDAPKVDGGKADYRRILPAKFASYEAGADHGFVEEFVASAPVIAQYCYAQYIKWRVNNPTADLPQSSEALTRVQEGSTESLAEAMLERMAEFGTTYEHFTPADTLYEAIKRRASMNYGLETQMYKALERRGLRKSRVTRDMPGGNKKQVSGWPGIKLHGIEVLEG